MNLKRILELIENDPSANEGAEPVSTEGKDCLDEIEIAAYYESNIPAPRRAQIENHLADCHRCVELLILFSKIAASPPENDRLANTDAQKLTDDIIRLINEDEAQR